MKNERRDGGERKGREEEGERKVGGVFPVAQWQNNPNRTNYQLQNCSTRFRVYPASTWLASRDVVAHVGTVQVTLASRGSPLPRVCKSDNVRWIVPRTFCPAKTLPHFFPLPFSSYSAGRGAGWHLTALHLPAPSIAPFRGSTGRSRTADLSPSGNCKFSLPGPDKLITMKSYQSFVI